MGSGIQDIPLRIPEKWDPKWFASFVRDVLAQADVRNMRVSGDLALTGQSSEFATLEMADGGVPLSRLENQAGLTVLGNPTSSTGPVQAIAAASDNHVFRRFGSTVGFGTIIAAAVSDFNEAAQDAVNLMIVNSARVTLTYVDGTPSLTADLVLGSVGNTYLANMAEGTVKGRAAGAGTGAPGDLSASQVGTIIQSIVPTWSGLHTFSANIVLANTSGPIIILSDTDAAADRKRYRLRVNTGVFSLQTEDDAGNAVTTLLDFQRTGAAVTSMTFGNTTDNPTFGFSGTGTVTASGQVTALRFVPTSATVATNGMYLPAANTVGLSANSTPCAQLTSTTFQALLQLILSGDISPAQLTANTDNWAPTGITTASVIRVDTDASRNLTGITGGSDGRILILINVGANPLVLVNDATSTAANRFLLASGTDSTVQAGGAAILWYDGTSSRWRHISRLA